MWYITFSVTVCLVLQSYAVFGDIFSAIAGMEELVTTEFELLKHLDTYIQAEEDKLKRLKTFYQTIENQYRKANLGAEEYVSNPVNAFLLVKRLTSDWKKVEDTMKENVAPDLLSNMSQQGISFPTEEDLNGAATALLRLQDTYELDAHALAEADFRGGKYSEKLTAGDCWQLGRQSFKNNDCYHTVLWMVEALNKHRTEQNKTISRQAILEYLAVCAFQKGFIDEALKVTVELLKTASNYKFVLGNEAFYEGLLNDLDGIWKMMFEGDLIEMDSSKPFSIANFESAKPSDAITETDKEYARLCRGEKLMNAVMESRLRCRYVTNDVPFLFIQPVKMEEASLEPYIIVYHEVISDNEIATIKKLAFPKFVRASVMDKVTAENVVLSSRVSKSGWLWNHEHEDVLKVNDRVGYITGLDMDSADALQVVNYGIGGQYEPHYDFATKDEEHAFKHKGCGNRIATWLFYMSDVEAGGATVFTEPKVSLWPRKGSAAFWYNLYPSGEGDPRTRHAGCPVLSGSKWVSNKWIHMKNQDLRRPCSLHHEVGV